MAYVRAMRKKKRKSAGPASKSATRTPSPKLNDSGNDGGLSGADALLDSSAYRGHVTELDKLSWVFILTVIPIRTLTFDLFYSYFELLDLFVSTKLHILL